MSRADCGGRPFRLSSRFFCFFIHLSIYKRVGSASLMQPEDYFEALPQNLVNHLYRGIVSFPLSDQSRHFITLPNTKGRHLID